MRPGIIVKANRKEKGFKPYGSPKIKNIIFVYIKALEAKTTKTIASLLSLLVFTLLLSM